MRFRLEGEAVHVSPETRHLCGDVGEESSNYDNGGEAVPPSAEQAGDGSVISTGGDGVRDSTMCPDSPRVGVGRVARSN